MAEFICENGRVYEVPERCCLTCGYCTDVFYDSEGPYMTICALNESKRNACLKSGFKKWVCIEYVKEKQRG